MPQKLHILINKRFIIIIVVLLFLPSCASNGRSEPNVIGIVGGTAGAILLTVPLLALNALGALDENVGSSAKIKPFDDEAKLKFAESVGRLKHCHGDAVCLPKELKNVIINRLNSHPKQLNQKNPIQRLMISNICSGRVDRLHQITFQMNS